MERWQDASSCQGMPDEPFRFTSPTTPGKASYPRKAADFMPKEPVRVHSPSEQQQEPVKLTAVKAFDLPTVTILSPKKSPITGKFPHAA
jgi:hypothetical protein